MVSRQVRLALDGLNQIVEPGASLVMAYEPVWAIGTGRASTAAGASQVIRDVIRGTMADVYGAGFAQAVRVLYGGSVNGKNAAEFFADSEIDGALVGGASLKPADFISIIQAAVH